MLMKIRQHVPGFVNDGEGGRRAEVDGFEKLSAVVREWFPSTRCVQVVNSGGQALIVDRLDDGSHRVLGYVDNPVDDLFKRSEPDA